MFKIIIVAVVVTIVGLFVMSQIDPNNNQTSGSNVVDKVSVDDKGNVKVTITGNVLHPGEYTISPSATLGELILKAGGALVGSDTSAFNDGLIIGTRTSFYIPTESEIPGTCIVTDIVKTNINTATRNELINMGGLNSSQIDALIAYRANNGSFLCLEDVMNVSGIGEKTYLSIRDKITIS